ncbi:TRPM8 channel-associated factor-like protein [Larimichthys crocea]|uniref:Uncharacterized protein n=1 Tax=Larimichthys crocea TaxID=215358 RepID=A0ACD3QJ35_LARCR|nr:TRPM8 channel-associated factor-like protein [Larimichthys crocea]
MSNYQSTQTPNETAYKSIMRGLRELDFRVSVPCKLVLTGDHAFPLAVNSQGQVLMAASVYGSGRIVVLGHESYLTAFPALVENALTWLRGDGSENLSVGVHKNVKAITDNLSNSIFQAKVVEAYSDNLGVGVYVTDAYSVGANVKDLVAFMKAGGGVLIGGQAWYWAQSHTKKNALVEFVGNKVSGVAGIYFTKHTGEAECLPVYPQIPFSWMAVVIGKDFEDDLEFLLQGVSEFDLQGGSIASEVLVHGPLAFPIGTTGDGRAFLAGAYYGQGRVIVVTHEGFLGRETLAPLWINAIHWLDEGRQGVVGVEPGYVVDTLSKSGLNCEKSNFRKDLSVFVCTAYRDDHAQEIQDFVAEGGGLLIGGHAWYWAQTHHGQNTLTDFSGNKILNKMGLSLLGATIGGGLYKAPVPSQVIKDTYHFRHLLHRFAGYVLQGDVLSKHEEECLTKLGQDCANYLHMNAHDSFCYAQVVSTLTDMLNSSMPQVCDSCPVKSPKDHLLLNVATEVYKVSKDPDALLPYIIKNNPLMPVVYNHRIKIDVNTAGVTTAAEWSKLRKAPAPWAELEFDNIILTVPSDYARNLDNPDELAAHWNEIMKAIADLAAKPHEFPRKERFVTDVQISAGWMHAGYPVMAHNHSAPELVDVTNAWSNGIWGPIHELGHNQQRSCWELPPNTTEATCNLWSVYVHEEVLGINREKAHPCLTVENRNSRIKEYVEGGKKINSWSVWLALETYLQLQEKFGWDGLKKVFAAYHQMSNFPKNNEGKMNLYAETFSKTVELNLTGFFKAWGWPIEKATEEKLSNLPLWSDHPMAQYA